MRTAIRARSLRIVSLCCCTKRCPLSEQHRPLANRVDRSVDRVPIRLARRRMGAKALRNSTAWLALLTNHFAASLAPALQLALNMLSPDRDIISNSPENSMALRFFRQLFVVFLSTGTLWAATDPFAGTWKLDPAKSKLTDQMKVEAAGPNKYTFIFSGDNSETIAADGTDQPGIFGTTFAVTVLSPNQWKVVRKTGGHVTISAIWDLSADGKVLTDNFTGYRADGTTSNLLYKYTRVEEVGSGFAGTWESVSEQVNSAYEMQVQTPRGRAVRRRSSPATTKASNLMARTTQPRAPICRQGIQLQAGASTIALSNSLTRSTARCSTHSRSRFHRTVKHSRSPRTFRATPSRTSRSSNASEMRVENNASRIHELDFAKIFIASKSTRMSRAYWKQAGQRRIPRAAIIAAPGLR